MPEKKIIIDIDSKGKIDAETFGIEGTDCLTELDRLLNDLALTTETTKKSEFFKEGTKVDKTIKVEK